MPTIDKIEILSKAKVRRSKLYYLRGRIGKRSKMKQVEVGEVMALATEPEKEISAREVPII